jgi:hypothetical protein
MASGITEPGLCPTLPTFGTFATQDLLLSPYCSESLWAEKILVIGRLVIGKKHRLFPGFKSNLQTAGI